jgi:phosphohistidine phosphatase
MQLIVLRHAKASREPGVADHDRPLTDRGRRNSREMGVWLVEHRLVPDLAIISDSKRTRQTFDLARTAFPDRLRIISDPDLYHASEGMLLAVLRQAPEGAQRILFCGHNPGLADFTTAIVGAGEKAALDRFRQGFPTATVAVLDFDIPSWRDARWRAARLTHYVTPASLSNDEEDQD